MAAGEVIYAGWSPLAGFNVQIDHGGGIVTKYFHGDGTFWVKVGQRVQQGEEIMMMGTSGNSTGVSCYGTGNMFYGNIIGPQANGTDATTGGCESDCCCFGASAKLLESVSHHNEKQSQVLGTAVLKFPRRKKTHL